MTFIEKLAVAIIGALCLAVLFFVYENYKSCEESGGIYVRGLFYYHCLK